jgi:hypothetical protein
MPLDAPVTNAVLLCGAGAFGMGLFLLLASPGAAGTAEGDMFIMMIAIIDVLHDDNSH